SNTDDAFEWFGGTVNCRYLVAAFCNDDNLYMDLGFQGSVQNVLIVQNNTSLGADNAFEFSGVTGNTTVGTGPNIADATKPVVFNVTAIGNGTSSSQVLRTNSGFQGQVHNSVFLNYGRGIRIDDALTQGLVGVNGLRFGGNTWVTPPTPVQSGGAAGTALYDGVSPLFNDEVANFAQLFFLGDAIPAQNSNSFEPQLAYASPLWGFNSAILSGITDIQDLSTDNQRININQLPYQGAFGVANWADCWTYLTQEGYFPGEASTGSFADADGDGVSDALESANTDLGFNPGVNDAATVLANVYTTAQVQADPGAFDLYDEDSIQNLRGTGMMIGPVTPGGSATVTLPLFSSPDLSTWTAAGNVTGTVSTPAGKSFFRVDVSNNAPNP
ncbi:MAG: hypothetical protein Q8Q59_16225, partial [Luteolibacter sp.]|nr:hypothetical protein [Luteolibacter sp.]